MVSNRLGDLRVRLQATVDEYERDMRRGTRATDELDESIGELDRRAGTATGTFDRFESGIGAIRGTILATTGVLAAGIAVLRQYNEQANQILVGAGIANITAQEYQSLSLAFRSFGVDADFVADILNDVSERLQDARDGTQSYADAFESLGIDLDEFSSLSRIQRLYALADAVSRVDDDTAQLAFNELAGDQGQRLLSVFRQFGSNEIRSAVDRFSEVTFTDAQLRSIRQASTELQFLGAQLQVLGAELVNIGTNRGVIGGLIGFLQLYSGAINDIVAGDFDRLVERFEERLEEAERISRTFGGSGRIPRTPAVAPGAPGTTPSVPLPEPQEYGRGIAEGFIRVVSSDGPFARGGAFDALNIVTTTSPADRQRAATGFTNEAALQGAQRLNDLEEQRFRQSERNQEALEAAERELQRQRLQRTLFWGSTIDTVLNAAVHGTEDWGAVFLQILSRIITQGLLSDGGFGALFGGGLQFGGTAFPGRSYLVGERGPELLIPNVASRVEPIAGAEINFYIDGDRRAQENFQMIDQQVIPQLEQIIDGRIIAQNRRPRSGVRRSTRGVR